MKHTDARVLPEPQAREHARRSGTHLLWMLVGSALAREGSHRLPVTAAEDCAPGALWLFPSLGLVSSAW